MKKNILLLSVALISAFSLTAAYAQNIFPTPGMIPAGSCSLPQGRYMLTNMSSGNSLYVEIDSTGKLLAQNPKSVNISVTSGSTLYQQQSNLTTTPASTTNPVEGQPKGSMWNSLLKQGVNSLLAPNQTPAN